MLFINMLTQEAEFKALRMLPIGEEGNFFLANEDHNKITDSAEAQVETIRYVLREYVYTKHPVVLEIGTNKGMFCLLMLYLVKNVTIFTFDINPKSEHAVEILKECDKFENAEIVFTAGDSALTLPQFRLNYRGLGLDLAWVDGNHTKKGCLTDLVNCAALDIPVILVDDSKQGIQVSHAITHFLSDNKDYVEVDNPFWDHDYKGITILVKRERVDW